MPKEGPKKFTKRDEREAERKAKQAELQRAKTQAGLQQKMLNEYNIRSNPNLPATKCERRALRAALAAEGISMTVWNSGADLSAFKDIARERFVNNRYAILMEDQENDFEHDPWLQMYLHIPEQHREEVTSDAAKKVLASAPAIEAAPRVKPVKMSRRQAKEAAERRAAQQNGSDHALSSSNVCAAGVDDTDAAVMVPQTDTTPSPPINTLNTVHASSASIPTGRVTIYDSENFALCADTAGNLKWAKFPPTSEGNIWTLQPGKNGKYTLRSRHGKYLSHCLMWGLVANRAAASDWELLTLAPAGKAAGNDVDNDRSQVEADHRQGVACTIQTWRGSYLGASPTTPAAAEEKATSLGAAAELRIVALPSLS